MRPNTPAPTTRMGEVFEGGLGGEDISLGVAIKVGVYIGGVFKIEVEIWWCMVKGPQAQVFTICIRKTGILMMR